MSDIPAWVGIVLAVMIVLGIVLEGLGLVALEWLDRRMSQRRKMENTIALLVVAVGVATWGLLQVYGH
jgi:hypothetical protein